METRSDGPDAPRGDAPERWVVRHYHRGGAIAPILGDRYLRLGAPRPVREYGTGRALERRGLPTPAHIAAAVYPSGIWYRGDLVTRWVPGSRDLAAVLFPGRSLEGPESGAPRSAAGAGAESGMGSGAGALEAGGPEAGGPEAGGAEAEAAMRATGRLFRRLHEGGVVHPDLNLKNVLIAGDVEAPDALVLDLDGATVTSRVGDGARLRMVARFWRSARKWRKATGVALDPS
ncbi:MAG: lipopolysaccharide kinase InaA family protein, partial [Longimicrobiales bacterium]